MRDETKTWRGPVLLAVLALTLSAAAAAPKPAVAPPQSRSHGTSYGEWAAAWWQWALGQPSDVNPVLDPTGEFCQVGQSGQVWFLAGTFGGSVERTCAVRPGHALLFPVLNTAYCAFLDDPPETRTEEFVRDQVEFIEGSTHLFATVDGKPVADVGRWLEKSALFTVVLPPDNVFGLPAGFVLDPCADEGFYLLLPPLPPGRHQVEFGGTFPDGNAVAATYHLAVEAR